MALAKSAGLEIVATTRSLKKSDELIAAGATHVVVDGGIIADEVRSIYPDGIDRVLELVGTITLLDSLQATNRGILEYCTSAGYEPMPIPKTRAELTEQARSSYEKLRAELDAAGSGIAEFPCVDDWSVKDLLAVRMWWTEHVLNWVEAGRRGESPITPAPGYRWKETPRLNADVVKKNRRKSYRSIRVRLEKGFQRVMDTIDALDDRELLEVGVFPWAGKYPISRWISINTTRQYLTARTYIRRTLRENGV